MKNYVRISKQAENWQMFLDHACSFPQKPVVLDYGCGEGIVVEALQKHSFKAYGCDIVLRTKNTMVSQMNAEFHIPFKDNFFDFIICNQVVEHVHNLDIMVAEFKRVLKPGGEAIIVCPTLETVIEWHLFVPFVHWFNRLYYIQKALLHFYSILGIGQSQTQNKKNWVNDRLQFLQNSTRYRWSSVIVRAFEKQNLEIQRTTEKFYYKKYDVPKLLRIFFNGLTLPYIVGSVFKIRMPKN